MKRSLPLLLVTIIAALCTGTAHAAYTHVLGPLPNDPSKAQIFRLDNGLTVQITENHDTPRFYAEMAVRAGGKDDPEATTGLAHYFEHLMFKGSANMGTVDYAKEAPLLQKIEDLYEQHFRETDPEKRKAIYAEIDKLNVESAQYAVPNEIDRVYTSMGGSDINAHTGTEETVYQVNLPKNRLRQWASIEADRFTSPVFRLFPLELETVYEEKNRSMDNKFNPIFERVNAALFPHHPYGQHTVLGTVEHLKNPSIKNIRQFFETWYVPENMALSIAGDVDTKETIEIVDEYFSKLPGKKAPKQPEWKEKKIEGRQYVETAYPGEEYVLLAFRTAPKLSKDADALILVDMILDNATAGLININLNQKQRVGEAGAFPNPQNDYGAQYLFGTPKKGQTLEEVEKLLLEQLDIMKRGELEDWILPAIITDFKKKEKGGLESNAMRASALSEAFICNEPWEHSVTAIERMEKITKEDIVRVARKYFSGGYVAGYRKDAKQDIVHVPKPELTKVDIDPGRMSKFAQQILEMPAPEIQPAFIEAGKDFQRFEDPNGIDVYCAPNPINDIFSMSITVEVGTRQDNAISAAARLLDKSGAGAIPAEELPKEWYKLGADFNITPGDNQTVITLSGLDENFEKSLKLMFELLNNPTSNPETLEALKSIILKQREDAKKQPPAIAGAVVQFNRFGADSQFLRMLPSEKIKALTVDQLLGLIKSLLTYKHTVSYAGSLPMDRVRQSLQQFHPVSAPLADPPAYQYLKARAPEKSEIYLFDTEAAQAQVRIESGGQEYSPDRVPVMELFNEYFSGSMAGLVFQELREARGLAYVAGARFLTGYRAKDQDLMIGVIQTQPDKTVEALTAFIDLMDKMPLSEQRFAIAKESLMNQFRSDKTSFREVASQVNGWERHGIAGDPRAAWFAAIQAGGMDAMAAFEKEQVAGKPKLISITGPASKMDLEALKKIGPVRMLKLQDIFVE